VRSLSTVVPQQILKRLIDVIEHFGLTASCTRQASNQVLRVVNVLFRGQ
jgi:hypothetical protein